MNENIIIPGLNCSLFVVVNTKTLHTVVIISLHTVLDNMKFGLNIICLKVNICYNRYKQSRTL